MLEIKRKVTKNEANTKNKGENRGTLFFDIPTNLQFCYCGFAGQPQNLIIIHLIIKDKYDHQPAHVQVFAPTHSQEAIDAILNSPENNNILTYENDPLRIITLKKQTNKTFARILTGKEALKSRNEFDMELR